MMRKMLVINSDPGSITVKSNIDDVSKRTKISAAKVKDFKVVNKKISILLDRWVQVNFKTEGKNVGSWPPFASGGRIVKGGIDGSAKLLQLTGNLRMSFKPFYDKKDAGIGSRLPYSKPHHEGLKNLPERRMLPNENLDEGLIRKVREMYVQHVKGAF